MKLSKIYDKYSTLSYNEDVYSVGGGLIETRFMSRRHEDAKYDEGKITLGKGVQLFKKATGISTEDVKEIILFAFPDLEWHHAGKLPKSYGGGMKKTYFLNSKEICYLAKNWENLIEQLNQKKKETHERKIRAEELEQKRKEYLLKYGEKVERVENIPKYFYCIYVECNGKYGWFDANKNIYGLPEYSTGWKFKNEQEYNNFLNLK